jgi:hypothetical protein
VNLLKEKSSYRPTRLEFALAWVITVASGLVTAWFVLVPLLRRQ